MRKNILLVDDEQQILRALFRLLSQTDYNVFVANNGEEALQLLKQNSVHLVISDIRMPIMDGYKLLEKIKMLYPNIIRVILSGYSDENEIVNAIQNNLAKTYIMKPWDNNDFIKFIENIFEGDRILRNENLSKTIHSIENLTTMPHLYKKINKLIIDEADMETISKVISEDQAITAKILKVVNSAFYDIKTASVKHAITYLGYNNVKKIILATSLYSSKEKQRLKFFNKNDLWNHAMLTNMLTNYLYERIFNKKMPDIYESAGLLHNIGLTIIMDYFPKDYNEIMECFLKSNNELKLTQIEMDVMGNTHGELGAYLLDWWQIPYPIVETALYHSTPISNKIINKDLIAVVHVADYFAWIKLHNKTVRNLNLEVFKLLNVSYKTCKTLLNEIVY